MYFAEIKSVASYLPENIITNDDLSKIVETSHEWISSRTGINQRHISQNEETSDICTKVAQSLLEKSKVLPEDIDMIIISTISPDYMTPSTACIVQDNIGAINAFAFDLNAACSGFIYGLSVADKYIASGNYKNIIVIGGETLSKLVDWSDRSTCVLFADGAGGALISSCDKKKILAEDMHSDGRSKMALYGKKLNLNNPFLHNYEIENEEYLKMKGKGIWDFATKEVPISILTAIEKAGLTLEDIKYIIPHQANYRIVEIIAKKLNIDMSKLYVNIQDVGNTSAATIPIALSEMVEKGLVTIGSGEKIVLAGFGAGVTWGSVVIEL